MTPGCELDALVAEKVMRCKIRRSEYYGHEGETECGCEEFQKHGPDDYQEEGLMTPYSTDISAVWSVVEKLRGEGWVFSLANAGGSWSAGFGRVGGKTVLEFAETAPLAICEAALEAVGFKEGSLEEAKKA